MVFGRRHVDEVSLQRAVERRATPHQRFVTARLLVKGLVQVPPTDRHEIGGLNYDCTQHKYLAALHRSAKVLPLQIPLFGKNIEIDAILENVDGIMLTGSHSNIHPRNYGETEQEPEFKLDVERDATILQIIKPTIEQGIPLFAICRGFQELNVAFGGTLHTSLDLVDSFNEHSEDTSLP